MGLDGSDRNGDRHPGQKVKGQLVADALNNQHTGTGATWRIRRWSVEVNKHGTIPHVTSSYCAIVTLSFAIFVFNKFHDLEMGVRGNSRSLRVLSFDRLCMVSY